MSKIQSTSFNRRLLQITPENARGCEAQVNRALAAKRVDGINLFGFDGEDLEFISRLKSCKVIRFQRCKNVDTTPLQSQRGLEQLSCAGDAVQFDLAHFPKLKGLSGFWHRKSRGLETLAKLEQLWLLGAGQPFKTVAELGLHPRLRELTITQNRVLTSLAGIEKLTKLEKLELNHMRGIDLAPLGKAKKLKHFEAESLNAFRNLERIASCRTLNYISMTGSGPLKSIRWAARMKWLEGLVLISSPVKDNDFSVIPKLPKLIYFSAPHHAAYRPKIADLEALVEARYEKAGL